MTIAAAIAIGFWLGINFGVCSGAPLPTGGEHNRHHRSPTRRQGHVPTRQGARDLRGGDQALAANPLTIRQQTRVLEQWPAI